MKQHSAFTSLIVRLRIYIETFFKQLNGFAKTADIYIRNTEVGKNMCLSHSSPNLPIRI